MTPFEWIDDKLFITETGIRRMKKQGIWEREKDRMQKSVFDKDKGIWEYVKVYIPEGHK